MPNTSRISLVTGAGGFVGANLTRALLLKSDDVHVVIRAREVGWRLKDIANRLRVHRMDLRDSASVKAIVSEVRPDTIFHLATAGVYGGKSVSDAELAETNFAGFINLVDATRGLGLQCFINSGSSSEYGVQKDAMKESDVGVPANVYGITKLAATQYASFIAHSESMPIVTLRLFSPFGFFDEPRRLIPTVISRLLRNEPLMLGSPGSVRDFIFIDDAVAAYLQCAEHAIEYKGEVFNVGSGCELSVQSVVGAVAKILGVTPHVTWQNPDGRRPWESPRWQADISKAERLLGWRPRISFEEGLERTVAWMRDHLKEYGP